MIFYDTSSLLKINIEDLKCPFVISGVTIKELENIKTSNNKSEDIKYRARIIAKFLKDNEGEYTIVVPKTNSYSAKLDSMGLDVTNDNLILCSALEYQNCNEGIEFYTEDILLRHIANVYFNFKVNTIADKPLDIYKGFKVVYPSESEMAYFYENLNANIFECQTNEYLVLKDNKNEIIDLKKWNGSKYVGIFNKNIKTTHFGDKIKPKDEFQKFAIDSIMSNVITILSGHAGSGKSLISLMVAMHLVETGKYDRLIILNNPTKARGATDLGFYSGSMQEKLLQNSIGNVLNTKFGDRFAVDVLLNQDKIRLISMADCRGMEVRENEILYITEAQNTTSELIKLCLSRACTGSKIIIEGDYDSQVDSYAYEGKYNGMRRAIDVLKGSGLFGCVNLQNVWRSDLAKLVDKI